MSKSASDKSPQSLDPLQAWRDWFIQSERDWSDALTRMMKDESVARTVGKEINAALYSQQMIKQGMAGPLAAFNLPTQQDIEALTDRIGRLEDAVARVEAGLLQMRNPSGTPSASPPRTRKALPAAAPDEPATPRPRVPRPARKARR
jgi:hypothetical protein